MKLKLALSRLWKLWQKVITIEWWVVKIAEWATGKPVIPQKLP